MLYFRYAEAMNYEPFSWEVAFMWTKMMNKAAHKPVFCVIRPNFLITKDGESYAGLPVQRTSSLFFAAASGIRPVLRRLLSSCNILTSRRTELDT
jgi:hypothetical protein